MEHDYAKKEDCKTESISKSTVMFQRWVQKKCEKRKNNSEKTEEGYCHETVLIKKSQIRDCR